MMISIFVERRENLWQTTIGNVKVAILGISAAIVQTGQQAIMKPLTQSRHPVSFAMNVRQNALTVIVSSSIIVHGSSVV